MDYQIGDMLKAADIGLLGERVSFIHCGHAADSVPGLLAHLEALDSETITVNRWGRQQVRRLGYVLGNPDILTAIKGGNGVGIINRQRLTNALKTCT